MAIALLTLFAAVLALAALVPFTRASHGIVRMCEFPRLQMVVLAAVCLLVLPILVAPSIWLFALASVFVAVIVLHGFAIGQFTPLRSPQSQLYEGDAEDDNVVSILSCNVKMSNRDYRRCLDMAHDVNADLALFMETDAGWAKGLAPLQDTYPHVVSRPYPNSYGMILYSRLPLNTVDVRFLAMDQVPCFVCDVRTRDHQSFRIYCVHPEPPVPNANSSGRDAELVRVAELARHDETPSIVFGDLNDVAWSHTTRLFQRLSRLLDPRVGRGFYNTFDARYPLLRWPLDHLFHDEHFSLVAIERCEPIGSDHFPMHFKLALTSTPSAVTVMDRSDTDDRAEADDITDQADALDRKAIGTDWEK